MEVELRKCFLRVLGLCLVVLLSLACGGNAKRESILDKVEHIEPKLVTELPKVPRLCDSMNIKKERIDVGGAELYVAEEGEGVAIVLINGGPGGTHHCFHPWFSRLAKKARVIYYDQRGCGLSHRKPGKDGYSVQQAVADLDAVRKAKKIDKWVVLGYSYGGFLAQLYALTYPDHLSGLVLLGAKPGISADTGSSRQHMFITDNERMRMEEVRKQLRELDKQKDLSRKELVGLYIYNFNLNGDWKRQNFYKPTPDRIAHVALYEWDHDKNFNSILNNSAYHFDFTGAFTANPIPTLILEGKWDLTWGEKKAQVLKDNHPNARLVMFDMAGHSIYDEASGEFFKVLGDFVTGLPGVSETKLTAFKAGIQQWHKSIEKRKKEEPRFLIKSIGWGTDSSKELVKYYSRSWIKKFKSGVDYLRTGFAHYDLKNYEEALFVFRQLEAFEEAGEKAAVKGVALVWQGHMLDLLGKREEALEYYGRAVQMDLKDQYMHGQYGLTYKISDYARERIATPFKRIDNRLVD